MISGIASCSPKISTGFRIDLVDATDQTSVPDMRDKCYSFDKKYEQLIAQRRILSVIRQLAVVTTK